MTRLPQAGAITAGPRHRRPLHQKIHQTPRLDRQMLARGIRRVDAERHRAPARRQFDPIAAAQKAA